MKDLRTYTTAFEAHFPVPSCISKINERPFYASEDSEELKSYLGKEEAFGLSWCHQQGVIDELMEEFCPYRMTQEQIDLRIKVNKVFDGVIKRLSKGKNK
jgi:hypothetical protein